MQGSLIKENDHIKNVKQFQTKFLTILQNLKHLNDSLYQTYISTQNEFTIETFEDDNSILKSVMVAPKPQLPHKN